MRIGILASAVIAMAAAQPLSAQPTLGVANVRVVEGDSGARTAEVTVQLSSPATGPVMVAYATRDATASAGSDYRAVSSTLAFSPGETTKRVAIAIVGDTAVEADETFGIVFSNPSGAAIGVKPGEVTVVNDDYAGTRGPAVYEVTFSFTGLVGSMSGGDCPGSRRNGTATMTGLIAGNEAVASDDDITYEGVLQMDVDIDLCEVTRNARGEDEFCVIRVVAAGPIAATFDVNADNRGGYVKARSAPVAMLAWVGGSCPNDALDEERAAFPDNSMANTFDGHELGVPSGPLRPGRRFAEEGMTLEVLRAVRSRP